MRTLRLLLFTAAAAGLAEVNGEAVGDTQAKAAGAVADAEIVED